MLFSTKYWYWKKELSPKMCDDIIKLGLSKKHKQATVFNNKLKTNKLKKIRNSDVVFLDDPWLFQLVFHYVNGANKNADWNFDIDYTENMQFTVYKENQHYDWHCDSLDDPYDCPKDVNRHGKIRKLSMSISLTDPKKYKGGDFEFDFRQHENIKKHNFLKAKELKPRGSIIVFPSYTWHRVLPVTSGTRYSLVAWVCGKPFK